MQQDRVRETCKCGAEIEVVSVVPKYEIAAFREAHRKCRETPSGSVGSIEAMCQVQGTRYCPDPKLIANSKDRERSISDHALCPPRNWANPALPRAAG